MSLRERRRIGVKALRATFGLPRKVVGREVEEREGFLDVATLLKDEDLGARRRMPLSLLGSRCHLLELPHPVRHPPLRTRSGLPNEYKRTHGSQQRGGE